MNAIELIAGVLAALAMIGAYFLEWRRGNNAERLVAVEARLAALESRPNRQPRIVAVEESLERIRRNA